MGPSGGLHLLLLVLLVFVFSEAIYVYIKVSPIVHGKFGKVTIYEKPERCGDIIVEGDSLGYEIARLGPFNYSCRLIERIDFFERRQDSSLTAFPYYYLVDKREVLECPANSGPYPLSDVLKGASSCAKNSDESCRKLMELRDYCKTIQADDCIVKCSEGEMPKPRSSECCPFITHSNGTRMCCPEGKFPGTYDGEGVCCPEKTSCCPEGEGVVRVENEGCPKDKMQEGGRCCYYITRNNTRSCCAEGMFPGKHNGEKVCCPHRGSCCRGGLHVDTVENGIAYCCPKGRHFQKISYKKVLCCPEGEKALQGSWECCATIKGQSGKEVCCPANTYPGIDDKGAEVCCPEKGSCCPNGQEVVGLVDNRAICCPKGKRTVSGSSQCCYAVKKKGRDVCCPEGSFPGKDANSNEVCCPQEKACCPQGTVITGEENGRATCCSKGEVFQKTLGGKDLCCPRGQKMLGTSSQCCYTIKQRDAQEVCCPENTFSGKDENGNDVCCPGSRREKCCPEGKLVSGLYKGRATCCPKGETFQEVVNGVDKCCPAGQKLVDEKCCGAVKVNGRDICCPDSYKYPGKYSGSEVCCQHKDRCCPEASEVGGLHRHFAICCPKGETLFVHNDKFICCPQGTVYRGMYNDRSVCCPNAMEWISGSSACCPPDFKYQEEFGKCLKLVPIDPTKNHTIKQLNTYCKILGADPVKIENEAQNKVISTKFPHAIIGLQIPEGQNWSKNGFRWVADGSEPSYKNFAGGEPNNYIKNGGPEYFVRLDGLYWMDVNGTPKWLGVGLQGKLVCMTVFVFSDAIYVYIKVSPIVHGEFGEVIIYEKPERCGDIIVEGDSLGYEIARLGPFNYSCHLIERIDFFERRQNSSPTAFPYYYLVDKREVLECPAMPGPYPLKDILNARPCDDAATRDRACDKLVEVREYCETIPSDDCVVECVEGQMQKPGSAECCSFITIDGKKSCCPDGKFLKKDKDRELRCSTSPDRATVEGEELVVKYGLAACCPKTYHLQKAPYKGVLCCPEGEKVLDGSWECCATIKGQNGKEVCCPANTYPGKDDKGAEVCCPEKGSCCPEGHDIITLDKIHTYTNVAVCCPNGTVVKDIVDIYTNMKPVCCPPEMRLTKGTSKCCSHTLQYNPVFGKCIGTVKIVGKPQNQREMNKHCSDIGAQPVKIENEQQNDVLEDSIIGLQIPEGWEWGEENFRWVSDNSKPNYTNWRFTEPNNAQYFTGFGTESIMQLDEDEFRGFAMASGRNVEIPPEALNRARHLLQIENEENEPTPVPPTPDSAPMTPVRTPVISRLSLTSQSGVTTPIRSHGLSSLNAKTTPVRTPGLRTPGNTQFRSPMATSRTPTSLSRTPISAKKNSKFRSPVIKREDIVTHRPREHPFSFPFPPYEIQKNLMEALTAAINARRVGIFESPTGTGKSLSTICAVLTWLNQFEANRRSELQQKMKNLEQGASADDEGSDWISAQKAKFTAKKELSKLEDDAAEVRKVDERLKEAREGRRKRVDGRKRKHDEDADSDEDMFADCVAKSPVDDADSDLLLDDEEARQSEVEEATLKCTKIYYASRTHSQLEQFLEEIRKTSFEPRVVQLASRQALCVNEEVRSLKNLNLMNERCLEMRKAKNSSQKTSKIDEEPASTRRNQKKVLCKCEFAKSDAVEDLADKILATDAAVRDIETLAKTGREMIACSYYASRKAQHLCEIVLLPYQILLHEKTRSIWGVDLKDNVVVIDEAHNLLSTVADIHSVELSLPQLTVGLSLVREYHEKFKERLSPSNLSHIEQLQKVIMLLEKKLGECAKTETDSIYSMAAFITELGLYEVNLFDVLSYAERTNLCNKFHGFFKRYCGRVNQKDKAKEEPKLSGVALLMKKRAEAKSGVTEDAELEENEEEQEKTRMSSPMYQIVSFIEALTNRCSDGRLLLKREEPAAGTSATYRFLLLNPAEKLKDLVKEARSVLLVGGTMEPAEQLIDAFERVCEVPKDSIARFSCGHVVGDDQLTAVSLARGPNGQDLTLTYANRLAPQVTLAIGMTFVNLFRQIPNGVVAFFASYDYMANFISQLKANKTYERINNIKPIFVEKRGASTKVWNDFQKQAKTAKGAMLCAVVGGKLSEGINFSDELGRCVFMVGLPYPNKNSVELQEKMKYLDQYVRKGAGSEHYEACCMHAVNQAIGRAIRHRNDYAAIVLLDARYAQPRISNALPKWISGRLTHCGTFPQALQKIVGFFKEKK
ncbi:hypothetical protein QR680_008071 [Steinernema hermaphroditum]|uniref:Helicase ATP-binding domain-containing protein n=1 Tax=Steinernema hermaphroditum TaxID=289476 RepID=A0AA39M7G0_9BILA|nr:hypothetical protein QR680_008071 [Steinernema hermaphroditum]